MLIHAGKLEAHPDGSITTSWIQGETSPRSAALSLRLATHAAVQGLSYDGCDLLANALTATIGTYREHPEILEEGRRPFMANAITMSVLERASQGSISGLPRSGAGLAPDRTQLC